MLQRQGYTVCALHGDMSQTARMEMLESFKNGQTNLMVATDVAARGLDIPNVSSVINYTFPLTIEDYIHRIGRTGESFVRMADCCFEHSIVILQDEGTRVGNRSLSSRETTTKGRLLESLQKYCGRVDLTTRR